MTPATVSRPPTKLPPGKHLAITVAIIACMLLGHWVAGCAPKAIRTNDLTKSYRSAYAHYYEQCITPAVVGGAGDYFRGVHSTPPTAAQLEQQRSQCAASLADLEKLQQQINATRN